MSLPKSSNKNRFPEGYEHVLNENNASIRFKQGAPYVFCDCCKKSFKSNQETMKHISSKEHGISKDTKHFLGLMRHIPPISESHRKALNDELSLIDRKFIGEDEIQWRIDLAEKYCQALESRIPGLKMCVYGCVTMGLMRTSDPVLLNATKLSSRSDVNSIEETELSKIFKILTNFSKYQDQPAVPESDRITLTNDRLHCRIIDGSENIPMEISNKSHNVVNFASLIKTYFGIDPRAKQLAKLVVVFSKKAQLCETLPIQAICTMVIFFLQRLSPPLLPNLHEIVRKYHENFSINCVTRVVLKDEDLSYLSDLTVLPKFFSSKDSYTLGDLWLKFLRFYVCEFQRRDYLISIVSSEPVKKSARKMKSSTLFVEDPFCPGTSLISDMTVHMDKFMHDQFLAAYVYFGIPRLKGASMPLFTHYTIELCKSLRRTFCLGSDGNQRHPLLTIPAAEFQTRIEKVSSSVSKGGRLIDIAVEILQLAISEICLPEYKIDVKKSYLKAPHILLSSYPMDSLLHASQAVEFARACCSNLWNAAQNDLNEGASKVQLLVLGRQVVQKALENMVISEEDMGKKAAGVGDASSPENTAAMEDSSHIEESTDIHGEVGPDQEDELNQTLAENVPQIDSHEFAWHKCINIEDQYKYIVFDSERPGYYNSTVIRELKSEDLAFPFKVNEPLPDHFIGSSIIAHPEPPPIGCAHCDMRGHLSSECPATNLQYWKQREAIVPKVANERHLHELSMCFSQLAQYHKLSAEMAARHRYVVDCLTAHFRQLYPDVSLVLFGSCANGFETKTSDMDICVVFPDNSINTLIWYVGSFNERERCNSLRISNIRPVFHAKVPIIKFLVDRTIEVDLSFSNFLAIYNTRMLRVYNEYEPRLRVLNTVLKVVLKTCGIPKSCDGGISSYAYAIMLIHYLQRIGYLPYLQEAYELNHRPVVMVSDWNVWFQEDSQIVLKKWQPPRDKATVAELWLGFLHYYLFEFDRGAYEVTIDTKELAPRVTSTNSFVIKDPFDLSHNMTQFVHDKLIIQIFTTFYNVLLHHSSTIRGDMNVDLWKHYLFSSPNLLAPLVNVSPEGDYQQKNSSGKRHKNKADAVKPVQNLALLGPPSAPPKLKPVSTQVPASHGNQTLTLWLLMRWSMSRCAYALQAFSSNDDSVYFLPGGNGSRANHINVNASPPDRMNRPLQPLNPHNQPVCLPPFAQQVHIVPVQANQRNAMNPSVVVGVPHHRGGRGGRGGQSHRRGGRARNSGRGPAVGISKTSGRSGLLQ
ncbi:unnamed protein product [Rodentolepis nana]|uniref:RNA uridylyltransferase n=1 Tax=Rodentolepis nana TaxID=102285 RepID=A0A0R3T2J6_RODNA|nr:unnamed protein product [Rodentolepis nana]